MNRIVLSFFLLFGILSAQTTAPADSGYQPRKEQLNTFERSFKPSFYDTEVYLYKRNDTGKTAGRSIDQLTTAAPETLQGFRVQILATNMFEEANTARTAVTQLFPELWIYLVFEAPTYKIRAGDFSNRAEAKSLMDQLKAQGYKNAWIVPDRIIRNQLPKPPLPVPIDSTSVIK
ncbi:MAG: SPOR domain-containing protein [Bacteroidota bacterium]